MATTKPTTDPGYEMKEGGFDDLPIGAKLRDANAISDMPIPRGVIQNSSKELGAKQPVGIPQAGTPEMDMFIQHINQNPAVMQQLPPQAVAEVLKHLGIDKEELTEVGEWMDDAADKTTGAPAAAEMDEMEADAEVEPVDEEA